MIPITQRTRDIVFRAGIALFLLGGALVLWSFPRFNDLPNFLRIAVLIPITSSYAMLRIDLYRNWSSVKGIARGYAIGALIGPPLLVIGSLAWLIAAPNARG